MAITHADLAPGRRSTDIGSKTATILMIFSILCGLMSFILCLIAETTRSEATWMVLRDGYECVYSGSGRTPLLCGGGAFLGLAIAMVVEHAYMVVALSKSEAPALIVCAPDSRSAKAITWQAGIFFVTSWVCFAVGEVLLLIGLGVESGHLTKWWRPRPSCLVIQQGLFTAAGVFALTTVFLAAGLYLTALRAQRLHQEEDNVRQEILDASILYASPPRSPRHLIMTTTIENPSLRQEHSDRPSHGDPPSLNKSMNLV